MRFSNYADENKKIKWFITDEDYISADKENSHFSIDNLIKALEELKKLKKHIKG